MWEIYAYQNSDSLFGIFNAVAAIMGSSTYLSAIAAVLFCGFVAAILASAFAPEKLHGWKWLGSVVLVYGLLFVPRVTVEIVDKTGGSAVKVVANVPFGMAMFGGLPSVIGNSITELFETAFQTIPGPGALPPELAYQQNGLMFGNRMVRSTRNANILDTSLRMDLVNFIANCTAYDLMDGTITPKAFSESDNLWSLIGTPNPARFTPITSSTGTQSIATCPDAYSNLSVRIPNGIAEVQTRLALELHPTLSPVDANSKIGGEIEAAFRGRIAASSKTASDMLYQNAMINAVGDASSLAGQKVNDTTGVMLSFARAQATAQQNAAWINGAKMAEQALPVLRNVIEALTYALFPIFVMLLFMTSGRETMLAVKLYVLVLLWIQLWPPVYAVLNYMGTIYANFDLGASASLGAGARALALRNANTIYGNAISGEAIVGSLVVAIPFLTWALASKAAHSVGSALGGAVGDLKGTVGAASSAGAAGNYNAGSMTLDQRTISPSQSNPWVSRSQDVRGNWWTQDGTGRQAVSLLRNEGITSHQVTASVTQSDVDTASKTASAAASEVLTAGTSRAASLSEALSRVRERSSTSRSGAGQTLAGFEEVSHAAENLSAETKRIAAETNYSESQVANTLLRFSATPSAYGVGGGIATEKRYGATLSEAEKKILDHSNTNTYKAARNFGDRVSRDQSFLNSLAAEGKAGASLSSSLAQTTNRADSAERRFNEAVSRSEQTSRAFKRGETITRNLAQDPAYVGAVMEYERSAARYGTNTQSMAADFASKLGNYSLNPSKFSDNSAVPNSFNDVKELHALQVREGAVNPDVDGTKAANDQDARTRSLVSPSSAPQAGTPGVPVMPAAPKLHAVAPDELRDPNAFREGVANDSQGQGNEVLHKTFDERHQIERNPDGSVTTHQSLVGTTARNLGRDAKVVKDDATEAANREMAAARERTAASPLQKDIDATSEVPRMLPKAGRRPTRE